MRGNEKRIEIAGLSEEQVNRIMNSVNAKLDSLSGLYSMNFDTRYGAVMFKVYSDDMNPEGTSSFYNVMDIINDEIRK